MPLCPNCASGVHEQATLESPCEHRPRNFDCTCEYVPYDFGCEPELIAIVQLPYGGGQILARRIVHMGDGQLKVVDLWSRKTLLNRHPDLEITWRPGTGPAEVLGKAADEIERRGLYQGDYLRRDVPVGEAPVGVRGAISIVIFGHPIPGTDARLAAFDEAAVRLAEHVPWGRGTHTFGTAVDRWGDKRGRTAREVAAKMRTVARDLRAVKVLEKAIAEIERRGHDPKCGYMNLAAAYHDPTTAPVSILGALSIAISGQRNPETLPMPERLIYRAAVRRIERQIDVPPGGVVTWGDSRTQPEVVEALRAAARQRGAV